MMIPIMISKLFNFSFPRAVLFLFAAGMMLGALPAQAAQKVDPHADPDAFLSAVAGNMLEAVKADPQALKGDTQAITALVRQYAMPYVNIDKTTRLAAGRHWREATDTQKQALASAFTNTLIRTYSGAFTQVSAGTSITLQPFRGDPQADDVVVRTLVSRANATPVAVDYRLEKTPDGWKVYDLNVEGIWLIQNYRNQFSQEIGRNGIDGLIAALNAKSGSR